MEIEDIKQGLKNGPGNIKAAKEKVDSAQKAFNEHEKLLEEKEAELMGVILMEKNGDNKARYSNDTMRANALIASKANDAGYKDLTSISRRLEGELMTAKNDWDLSINTFSAVKHIADLTASQLRAQDTICTHVDDRKKTKQEEKQ